MPRMTSWSFRGYGSATGLWSLLLLAGSFTSSPAQVVLDGKFGTSGALAGPNIGVTAEMGTTRGNNLFHSFTQFDLKAGDVANFSGPASIQNILSRVTGGKASSINGTIRSEITGANFFFINPGGVIFGPKATVDVSGSFAASTADYLKLADGTQFMAALDADDSGLSTAPVSAFGFLGNSPGSIAVQGSALKVKDSKEFSLVGGDVSVDKGSVRAPRGQINVASVRSAGEVPLDPSATGVAEFTTAFPKQGQVNFKNEAQVDASGVGGGRIVIRGGRLTVDDSKIQSNTTGSTAGKGIDIAVAGDLELSNGGQINSLSTRGLGTGGNITVNAKSIQLNGGGLMDENFNPATQISTATGELFVGGGSAKGGDILINTGRLELVNSAQVSSATFGAGSAGRIEITASSVRMDALLTTATQISANTQQNRGGGNAGDIVLHTDTLDMLNGATILAASFGSGKAGLIDINARSMNLLSGGIITAGTFGSANGGNVNIQAESMHVDGRDILTGGPDFLTGVQAVTTSPDSPAPGGSIRITANSFDLEHNGSVFTTSYGRGPGGNVEVTSRNLTLANGSTIRAAGEAAGPAGTVSVNAGRDVKLTGNSAVSTSALQSSGGNIRVNAGEKIQLFGSQITAQAGPGGGGNIVLSAPSMIYQLESTFTAQAVGDGGNLTITDPVFFIPNKGGLISKSSSANGGNITILSDYFFQSGSIIDASAPFGLPGTVSVSAPQVDLSGSLIGLPDDLLGADTQLRPDCAVRLTGNVSSFIVLGRGGLPLEPGGFLPSGAVAYREDKK